MHILKALSIVIAIAIGFGSTLVLTIIWWVARASERQWTVLMDWNSLGEAVPEGYLLHACLAFSAFVLAMLPKWTR